MAYLITHFWPGATMDQYNATVAVMHNPWPEGQLYHAAGPTDGGVLEEHNLRTALVTTSPGRLVGPSKREDGETS